MLTKPAGTSVGAHNASVQIGAAAQTASVAGAGVGLVEAPSVWCAPSEHLSSGWVYRDSNERRWRRECVRAGCEWWQDTAVDPAEPAHPDRALLDEVSGGR